MAAKPSWEQLAWGQRRQQGRIPILFGDLGAGPAQGRQGPGNRQLRVIPMDRPLAFLTPVVRGFVKHLGLVAQGEEGGPLTSRTDLPRPGGAFPHPWSGLLGALGWYWARRGTATGDAGRAVEHRCIRGVEALPTAEGIWRRSLEIPGLPWRRFYVARNTVDSGAWLARWRGSAAHGGRGIVWSVQAFQQGNPCSGCSPAGPAAIRPSSQA